MTGKGFGRALRVGARPVAGLVGLGLFWGAFAAWLPAVKARAGIGDGTMGLVLLGAAVGNIVAMTAYPHLARRFGARLLPGAGLVLAAASVAQLSGAGGPLPLFAALALMGLAMASVDVAANVRLSVLEARHDLPLMNLAHGLYSLAFAASAFAAGLARGAGVAQAAVVGTLALLLVGMAAAMREPAPDTAPAAGTAPAGTPWAVVLPAGLILFAGFIAENATETWSALHIERTLHAAPGEGAFGPAMMGLMMAGGRLSGQALAARWGEVRLVAVSTVIAMTGALILAAAPTRGLAIAAVALIGIGTAVLVPSANALLGRRVTAAARPLAISRAWMLGFTGFFVGPVAMGWVAEGAGLRAGFVAVALVLGLVFAGLGRLRD